MAKIKNKKFNKVEDPRSTSLLEEGKHLAKIVNTEYKPTAAKTGRYLSVECLIRKGPDKGRKIWANLNLDNPNELAEDIAWKEYKGLHMALGLTQFVKDTKTLHKKLLIINVVTKPATKKTKHRKAYPAKSEINGFDALPKGKGKSKKPW